MKLAEQPRAFRVRRFPCALLALTLGLASGQEARADGLADEAELQTAGRP